MSSVKLNIYCVTNKVVRDLENTNLKLAAVGKNKFPENYLQSNRFEQYC